MRDYQSIRVEFGPESPVARLWLARPELRNAFDPLMIAELRACFEDLALQPALDLRAVVLRGSGGFFCSGGDLNWMRSMSAYSEAENLADAEALAAMLAAVSACPVPLIAAVEGGAYGGGLGLLCCCDFVLCGGPVSFAFSEVRLGIAPATIAPYVLQRLVPSAQGLLLSGEAFGAETALHSGLASQLCAAEELESAIEARLKEVLKAGPQAIRETKALLRSLRGGTVQPEIQQMTAALIARLRASAEGQEGLSAFLEKRSPAWKVSSN